MPRIRSTIIMIGVLIACNAIQPVFADGHTSYDKNYDYGSDEIGSWDNSLMIDSLTSLLVGSYKNSDNGDKGKGKKDNDKREPTAAPEPETTQEADTPGLAPTATPTPAPGITPAPEATPAPVSTGGYRLPTGTMPYPPEGFIIDRAAWLASGNSAAPGTPAPDNTTADNVTMAGQLTVTPVAEEGAEAPDWNPGTRPGQATSPGLPQDIPLILLVIACTSYIGYVAYSVARKG